MNKTCTKCGELKDLSLFYNHKNSRDGKTQACAVCMKNQHAQYRNTKEYAERVNSLSFKENRKEWKKENKVNLAIKRKIWNDKNSDKLIQHSKNYKGNNTISYLLAKAKQNAKVKKLKFTLDETDVNIPKYCPYLELELNIFDAKRIASPSIDRIDNSKGYIKGNVQVISALANRMKNNATVEQLKTFAKNILTTLK